MDNIQIFLELSVVGALVAAAFQALKSRYTDPARLKAAVAVVSVVIAAFFVWLQSTPWLPTVMTILTTSQFVWAFFMKDTKSAAEKNPVPEAEPA